MYVTDTTVIKAAGIRLIQYNFFSWARNTDTAHRVTQARVWFVHAKYCQIVLKPSLSAMLYHNISPPAAKSMEVTISLFSGDFWFMCRASARISLAERKAVSPVETAAATTPIMAMIPPTFPSHDLLIMLTTEAAEPMACPWMTAPVSGL